MQLWPLDTEFSDLSKKKAQSDGPTFLEFFAGIGLVRMGLEVAGWRPIWANDIDQQKRDMYNKHFGDAANHFETGDIRHLNPKLVSKFSLIYCGKTLYYVGPEIDVCVNHIGAYLSDGGLLCYTYNQRDDSFSNRYLTYDILRAKLLDYGFEEKIFVEITDLAADEKLVVHICQKGAQ